VTVQVVVQHHPARADLLPRLTDRLTNPVIVTDPGGELSSAWRTYRLCLGAAAGADHVLIVQDDATVPDGFEEATRNAIAARPDAPIAFFVSPQARLTAHAMTHATAHRVPWARWETRDFWPTVCSSYPAKDAERIRDFVDRNDPGARGDDAPVGDAMRALRIPGFVTVPSLVEHPDDVPSLIGRKHMAGLNPGRLAKWPLGETDPRTIRW
jgi:hypothetical protein